MIGYYAHHVGAGHLTRAALFASHSAEPVTLLGSRAGGDRSAFADVVTLERDDDLPGADIVAAPDTELDAHGALHWAPLGHGGYAARMARIAAWVAEARPRAVVVDVSSEVAALVRTLGVPVVVVAQPGDRRDDAHELARRCASGIVAPWPREAYVPAWLVPHLGRTTFVGSLSRFHDRTPLGSPRRQHVLVVGGGDVAAGLDLDGARRATPGWTWTTAGVTGRDWHEDLWPALCGAEVVVTHAGQNALADVAAAARPAVVVASPRPHDEQRTTTGVLRSHEVATGLDEWPDPERWPVLLDAARARGGDGWAAWRRPDAVGHMVRAVEQAAR